MAFVASKPRGEGTPAYKRRIHPEILVTESAASAVLMDMRTDYRAHSMNRTLGKPFVLLSQFLRRLPALLFVCTAVVFALGTACAAEPAKRAFDIPAGRAETTLRLFSEQAGGQFIFSADKVAGVRTLAV